MLVWIVNRYLSNKYASLYKEVDIWATDAWSNELYKDALNSSDLR